MLGSCVQKADTKTMCASGVGTAGFWTRQPACRAGRCLAGRRPMETHVRHRRIRLAKKGVSADVDDARWCYLSG